MEWTKDLLSTKLLPDSISSVLLELPWPHYGYRWYLLYTDLAGKNYAFMYRNFISFWRGAENLKLPMSPSDLDKTLCAPKFPGSSCCSCMAVLVCPEAELFGAWPSTAQLFGTLVSGGWEMGRMLLLFHSSQRPCSILLGPLFFSCMQGIKNQRLTGAEIDLGNRNMDSSWNPTVTSLTQKSSVNALVL